MPSVGEVEPDALRRSMGLFPVSGLLLGFFLWGCAWAGTHLMPRLAAAIVVLAVYTVATGALHLDGLADTFDGIGSRKPADEALAIMKDSRIGTMGSAAILLVLMGKAAAFSRLPIDEVGVWVVVPVLARTAVVWSMMSAPAARPEGLGAFYARRLPPSAVIGATVVGIVAAAVLLPWQTALMLVVLASAITIFWSFWIRQRLGGSTGDTYGALVEMIEWAGFLALTGVLNYGR